MTEVATLTSTDPVQAVDRARPAASFAHLEGLRGMAAMIVVLCQCSLAFQPTPLSGDPVQAHFAASVWLSRTPLTFFWSPELSVAIFFVLSGFVLSASVNRKPAPWPELAVRRWIRLSGLILGSSLIIWVIVHCGLLHNQPVAAANGSDWLAGNFAWLAFQSNDLLALLWQSLVDIYARSIHWWNFALWTMPVEFWGSLALFACQAGLRRAMAPPAAGLGVACLLWALTWRSAYGGFAAGAALYQVSMLSCRWDKSSVVTWPAGTTLLALGIILGGMPWNLAGTPYWTSFAWLSARIDNPITVVHRLGAVCVVAASLTLPPLRFILTTAPFRFLGRTSFMLYLLHIVLICSLFAWIVSHLTAPFGYNAATAVGFMAFLVVLLAAAAITEKLIDQPSIRLARLGGILAQRMIDHLTGAVRLRLAFARR
jgi:peptidoglycan/LPS O-acetylase OafA/YrhL